MNVKNARTAGERISPNVSEPFHLSSEWLEMDMMAMIRTPDVDNPSITPGTPANVKAMASMTGKQRRFEFQYELQLKKVPTGKQVYFASELEEPIKMGIIQPASVGAAMAFVKTTNNNFHCSIQGSKKSQDSKYEKPHMSFSVEDGSNRVVVTRPGETTPKLGGVIEEDAESIKRRQKAPIALLGIPKIRMPWPCGGTMPKLGGVIEEDAESIKRRKKAPPGLQWMSTGSGFGTCRRWSE
jgi:hypothetical protein